MTGSRRGHVVVWKRWEQGPPRKVGSTTCIVQLDDEGVVGFLFVREKCESKRSCSSGKGSSFLDTAELLSRAFKSSTLQKAVLCFSARLLPFFGEILHLILTKLFFIFSIHKEIFDIFFFYLLYIEIIMIRYSIDLTWHLYCDLRSIVAS